jgi:glutamyl-tRNA synthetase
MEKNLECGNNISAKNNLMNSKKIRVRFAPSPTGYMHIGNFRTALYTYLFAQKNKGVFILRIEDTDQKRFVPDALEKLINILNWAGLKYNEGVYFENDNFIQRGECGPYIQSERLDLYKKYAQELLDKGQAYYCFCAPERLEKMREEQLKNKQAPMYDRTCLKLSKEEIAQKIKNGESYVIRQKINTEGFTEFDDLIRGKVSIKNELLDDQVLLKSDGYPTYNFANVIDDYLMEITHVLRGEEYISSTPKYIQLYDNYGWDKPKIAHLPLILNPDKTKLSKRQGDVAVEDYIQKGYLKEAIINFVALLGWNPGEGETQEIFTLEELIEKFDLSHVHKGGAVFDVKKLDWINSEWIKKLSVDELYERSKEFWEQKDFYKNAPEEKKSEEYLKKVLAIEQDRLNNLSEVGESNRFFFEDIKYDKELLRWKKMSDEDLKKSLEKSQEVLEKITEIDWTKENLEKVLLETAGDKKGDLLWPLRVALTGAQKSPSPFECAWVLGKESSLQRIDQALSLI